MKTFKNIFTFLFAVIFLILLALPSLSYLYVLLMAF